MSEETILLVGNPTAQSGEAKHVIDKALAGLAERGISATLLETQPEGRTVPLVRDRVDASRPDVVIYLGGDGTFNEVARGILAASKPVPMGMLPMGTANDQGRSFGIHPGGAHVDANLDIILAGHLTMLDVGHVEAFDADDTVLGEGWFFDSAGWGLQPDILRRRNEDRAEVEEIPLLREIYRNELVYAGATVDRFLSSFVEPTKFDAVIASEEGEHEYKGLTDLIIKGTAVYGGKWVLDRHGEPDDGKFELVPIQGRRDWASKTIRDLVAVPMWQEDLDLLGVTHSEGFSASHFGMTLQRPGREQINSQIDGEEWLSGDRYRVEVVANKLPLITRADFAPPWKT